MAHDPQSLKSCRIVGVLLSQRFPSRDSTSVCLRDGEDDDLSVLDVKVVLEWSIDFWKRGVDGRSRGRLMPVYS